MVGQQTFRLIGAAFFCLGLGPTDADDSLYDYMEISLQESGGIEIVISIHAADFVTDNSVDVSDSEASWFRLFSEEEKSSLIQRANEKLTDSILVRTGPSQTGVSKAIPVPLIPRSASIDAETRPGSLHASDVIHLPTEQIVVQYEGEKRLLVVLTRTGRFPEIYDLGPGMNGTIRLANTEEKE